jgi:hypothetical protein
VETAGDVKAVFTTAGTLGPVGIRGWLLGELPDPIRVRGDASPIRKYVLGTTGHDGVTAVVIENAATRVVCQNTLGVALGERGGASWRIQHTANVKVRLEEAGKAFCRVAESYTRLGELANVLAVSPFTEKRITATVYRLMPVPKDDRDHNRLEAERGKVLRLFETAVGIERVRGTAWAASRRSRTSPAIEAAVLEPRGSKWSQRVQRRMTWSPRRWTARSRMLSRGVTGGRVLESAGMGAALASGLASGFAAQGRENPRLRPRRPLRRESRRAARQQTDPPLPTTGSGDRSAVTLEVQTREWRRGRRGLGPRGPK